MANEIASAGTQTETVSAERAAADSGNVSAFLEASRDRRAGKAPAAVERTKATEPAPEAGATRRQQPTGRGGVEARGPKPADRDADERLTTRVREAVDTSTAELRRQNQELADEIAAIRRRTSTGTTEQAGATGSEKPAARKALTSADIRKYSELPDAPRLDEKDAAGNFLYETAAEHTVALNEFIREKRDEERQAETRQSGDRVARIKHETERHSTFAGRIEAFKTANPDRLVDNGKGVKTLPFSPEVAAMHGYSRLAEINQERQGRGLEPIPATVDHAITEEIYDSEIPTECALYLSEHPEELANLRKAQSPAQLTRAFGALEERVRRGTTNTAAAGREPAAATPRTDTTAARREAEAAVDRSVSSTKPLKTENLGRGGRTESDPERSAIATGDFGAFAEVQRARRQEKLTGARR